MNILVTGAQGFVGKNLVATLKHTESVTVDEVVRSTSQADLESYAQRADFVYHLAGVNRPDNDNKFFEGNVDFTDQLLNTLKKTNNTAPVLITSSIKATQDSAYGRSKKAGEDLIFKYGEETNASVIVYRLPNLFGKWSKPNYNTVIATFAHNIARGLDIQVNDPKVELPLVYIDDLVEELLRALDGHPTMDENNTFAIVPIVYHKKLGYIAETLQAFKDSRENRVIPNLNDSFVNKLYSTYLNFLPEDNFSYPLVMHEDKRGSFTEFVKSPYAGQVSVNVSKPGITKGEHWHHTKHEKFLVVSGQGVVRFRDVYSDEIIEYEVSGDRLEVVDIPTGYTHSIVNTGDSDMVTIMWVNEKFDPNNPDTFFLEV